MKRARWNRTDEVDPLYNTFIRYANQAMDRLDRDLQYSKKHLKPTPHAHWRYLWAAVGLPTPRPFTFDVGGIITQHDIHCYAAWLAACRIRAVLVTLWRRRAHPLPPDMCTLVAAMCVTPATARVPSCAWLNGWGTSVRSTRIWSTWHAFVMTPANDPFFMIGSKHIESETQIHRERDGMWVYDVPRPDFLRQLLITTRYRMSHLHAAHMPGGNGDIDSELLMTFDDAVADCVAFVGPNLRRTQYQFMVHNLPSCFLRSASPLVSDHPLVGLFQKHPPCPAGTNGRLILHWSAKNRHLRGMYMDHRNRFYFEPDPACNAVWDRVTIQTFYPLHNPRDSRCVAAIWLGQSPVYALDEPSPSL